MRMVAYDISVTCELIFSFCLLMLRRITRVQVCDARDGD